ncbi:hypothetical protein RIF29_38608 [Crotalaria pallida]|uniref:Uncharacterized protein n=1 Tax=Crotalaria pallida TaxID=3830 RepID=A0AAN9HP38_CROPI
MRLLLIKYKQGEARIQLQHNCSTTAQALSHPWIKNALQYRRMDFDEFCAAALSVHQLEALDRWEQHARCAYEIFEKDGNRAIVIEELASVGSQFNWRVAFWGEAILMLPFPILGFVMKPLQLEGFAPLESKQITTSIETNVSETGEGKASSENQQLALSGDNPVTITASGNGGDNATIMEEISEKIGENNEVSNEDIPNKGLNNLTDTKSEASHFGPWMLVRKSPRIRGKGLATLKDFNQGGINGSRFASLNEENEMGSEDTNPPRVIVDDSANNNNKEENIGLSTKRIKVRNPYAGKTPQNRPKQFLSPKTFKGPIINQKQPPEVTKPKQISDLKKDSNVAHEEPPRYSNKTENEILHRMKIMQKQGVTGIDNIATHVFLPDPDMVDFAHLRRGSNTVINPVTVPPDKTINSATQNSMEIDKASSSSVYTGMERDASHPAGVDLEGQISIENK